MTEFLEAAKLLKKNCFHHLLVVGYSNLSLPSFFSRSIILDPLSSPSALCLKVDLLIYSLLSAA